MIDYSTIESIISDAINGSIDDISDVCTTDVNVFISVLMRSISGLLLSD